MPKECFSLCWQERDPRAPQACSRDFTMVLGPVEAFYIIPPLPSSAANPSSEESRKSHTVLCGGPEGRVARCLPVTTNRVACESIQDHIPGMFLCSSSRFNTQDLWHQLESLRGRVTETPNPTAQVSDVLPRAPPPDEPDEPTHPFSLSKCAVAEKAALQG